MLTETLIYRDGDLELHGYLATPEGAGRRPGILVVPEIWGLDQNPRRRAEMLAELGYVALAVDMYGGGKVVDSLEAGMAEIGEMRADPAKLRARAKAGLDTLAARAEVDPERLAAIGYCFGGFVALELARMGAPIAGAVSFHGALETGAPAQPGTVSAKVLVCHGSGDPLVPPEQVAGFQKEMEAAGADWQFIAYGGAVHSFAIPGSDAHGIPGVAYHGPSDRRSWAAMRAFFGEIFGEG